jgi:hypothetical protein
MRDVIAATYEVALWTLLPRFHSSCKKRKVKGINATLVKSDLMPPDIQHHSLRVLRHPGHESHVPGNDNDKACSCGQLCVS